MKFEYKKLQIQGVKQEEKERWKKKSVDLGYHTLTDYLKTLLLKFKYEGLEVEVGRDQVAVSSFDPNDIDIPSPRLRSRAVRYFINKRAK